MAGTKPTKTLLSEVETTELGGPNRKVTVEYDHLSNDEITTHWVSDGVSGWVTESVKTAQQAAWSTNVVYGTIDPSNAWSQSGSITNPITTTPIITTGAGSVVFNSGGESFNVEDLIPLLDLVGSCVACGDDAELLLCPPCGLAVRELGRSRLKEYMREIQEELS